MKRTYLVSVGLFVAAGACRGSAKPGAGSFHPATPPAEALRPAFIAKVLRRLGGAHFHGTARFAVGPVGAPADVTTVTDLIVDRAGNYRLSETNDRDGGREVVLYGRELSIALRYGRMIRRVAEEPEPSRLSEEAVGAPWAVFELVAPAAIVSQTGSMVYGGTKATVFALGLAGGGPSARTGAPAEDRPGGSAPRSALEAWRSTASIEALWGQLVIDDATGALMKADLSARFSARGEGGPVAGTVEVHSALSDVAATAAIRRPQAEELALRQRIVPEQHDLLRGLVEARVPDAPRHVPVRRP